MPMFHTPKPRRFSYQPRFYDPEKERWEARKAEYRMRHGMPIEEALADSTTGGTSGMDSDEALAYFEQRVRQMEERKQREKLGWKDLFRKREKPQFHYQPRFASTEGTTADTAENHIAEFKKRGVSIKRRFDISDTEYMKPMPAGRIMLYAMLVCILLYLIIF